MIPFAAIITVMICFSVTMAIASLMANGSGNKGRSNTMFMGATVGIMFIGLMCLTIYSLVWVIIGAIFFAVGLVAAVAAIAVS